jgi:DNA-binding phage protein
MAKTKTSGRRGKSLRRTDSKFDPDKFEYVSLKSNAPVEKHDPKARLRNRRFIAKALFEAFTDGDTKAFKEILKAHLESANKNNVALRSGVPRSTVFRMLEPESNPTLDNIAKVLRILKLT